MVRDHYCPYHAHLSNRCMVLSCNKVAEIGFQTCLDPNHQGFEIKYKMSSKAMFQLQNHLEHSYPIFSAPNTSHTEVSGINADQGIEVMEDDCSGGPVDGNQKPQAHFGHQRTHNDELCVASCSIILGQTTFYGSEAPSAICVCSM